MTTLRNRSLLGFAPLLIASLVASSGCVLLDGGGSSGEWVLCYHLVEYESTGGRSFYGHCEYSRTSLEATCQEVLDSVYRSSSFEGGYIGTFGSEAECEAEDDRINRYYDIEGHESLPYPPERILRGGGSVPPPTADAGPREGGTTEPGECPENMIPVDMGEEPLRGAAYVRVTGCLYGSLGAASEGLYRPRDGGGYCVTPILGGATANWCDRTLMFTNTIGVYWSLRDESGTSYVDHWWPARNGDNTVIEIP